MKTRTKVLIKIILGLLVIVVVFFAGMFVGKFFIIDAMFKTMMPTTDEIAKICEIVKENKQMLLNIPGVVGAGIGLEEYKPTITGIAIYIEDSADIQKIPKKIGQFNVIVKKIDEATKLEKEGMIIRK